MIDNEQLAATAGEEDHTDIDAFRGDEADSPVDDLVTELADVEDEGSEDA